KDFEKGTHALCELNLWFVEQLITRQNNTMLTWQQIKRICGSEQKEKYLYGVFAQQEEINVSQIKPKKRKISLKRSKKEWVIGQRKNNTESFLDKVEKKSPNKKRNRRHEFMDKKEKLRKIVTAIGLKHLKNMIAPEKKIRGKKKSKVEHVTLAESWDIYLIQNLVENR
ncbi:25562_t:CDS:2, partial [Gigaspora rosea]